MTFSHNITLTVCGGMGDRYVAWIMSWNSMKLCVYLFIYLCFWEYQSEGLLGKCSYHHRAAVYYLTIVLLGPGCFTLFFKFTAAVFFFERGLWLRLITEYCVHSWPEKSHRLAIIVVFSEHLLFINSVYFALICHSYPQITLSTGLERWERNRWWKQIRFT